MLDRAQSLDPAERIRINAGHMTRTRFSAPTTSRVRGHALDMDSACLNLHDEEHVQALEEHAIDVGEGASPQDQRHQDSSKPTPPKPGYISTTGKPHRHLNTR